MFNNPIITIFGGFDSAAKGLLGTVSSLWLLFRTKRWHRSFPGVEKILTNEGRAWVLDGLGLATEYAELTDNTVDDLVIGRIWTVVNTDEGWKSIRTIVEIAIESPDTMYGTEPNVDRAANSALSTCLMHDARKMLGVTKTFSGDEISEDPITVLYIILICLQIAQRIRERREKTKEGQARIRRFFQRAEQEFTGKVINFGVLS